MRMILIKNEKTIDKMSSEKRNKYLQKLESRREVVYNKILELRPPKNYIISPQNNKNVKPHYKFGIIINLKKNSLNNELYSINNAIWHIGHLNCLDKCKQINECQNYEREF